MKKLLSIAAVAALFATGAIADSITINGEVLAGAQVSFGAAPVGDLVGGTFEFEDAFIDFEDLKLGQDNIDNQDVYVKTNSNNGVNITLVTTPDLDDGNGHTVPTTYALGGVNFVAGTAQSLTDGTNDGTAAIANKFTTTATPAADQVSGIYTTSIDVTIAQN
jgi:hypothetical protein